MVAGTWEPSTDPGQGADLLSWTRGRSTQTRDGSRTGKGREARVLVPTPACPAWVVSTGLPAATPHPRRDPLPRPGWSLTKVSPPSRSSSKQAAPRQAAPGTAIPIPLQDPGPVLEHLHGGLMICRCIHREFPLCPFLLPPPTVSPCTFEKPWVQLPCTLPLGLRWPNVPCPTAKGAQQRLETSQGPQALSRAGQGDPEELG